MAVAELLCALIIHVLCMHTSSLPVGSACVCTTKDNIPRTSLAEGEFTQWCDAKLAITEATSNDLHDCDQDETVDGICLFCAI